MNTLIDYFLVGAVLLASVTYAIYKLGPRNLRRRLIRLSGRSAAAGKPQGNCGGCDNCGDVSTPVQSSSSGDIKIPLGKIGRRS